MKFRHVFNFKDEYARGRSCMLISQFIVSIITYLTTGIFYSGFLSSAGIDIVKIGIVSFIPFFANMFSIFSPVILEKIEKRKWILIAGKLIYYGLNIFCITLLPSFFTDGTSYIIPAERVNSALAAFLVITFIANVANALVTSGFTTWQVVFIPDHIRADFFAYSQTFAAAISGIVIIVSSYITDSIQANSPDKVYLIISILRYVAFAFSIVDLIVNAIPKEYPYARKEKTNFWNIFKLPIKNKKFLITMLFVVIWCVNANLTYSLLDTYLLTDVGVKYTYVCIINAIYALFLFGFSWFWKKMIRKYSWLKIFAITVLCHVPTTLAYAFVTGGNYLILMTIVRLTQHFLGVGLNVTYANLVYINMPEEDRTNYVSFHLFISNVASLAGIAIGTTIVNLMGDNSLVLFGYSFSSVPCLLLIQAVGQLVLPLVIFKLLPKAQPDN